MTEKFLQETVVPATFYSEWDDGSVFATSCVVNLETKAVFDISTVDVDPDAALVKEYVEISGEKYPVFEKDEAGTEEFWY